MKRYIPILVLVGLLVTVYALGLHNYLSFETLKQYRFQLLELVESQYVLTVLGFMALYTVVIALSIPGGAILTITSGFLFGSLFGTLFVVIAATAGATALFMLAKSTVGDHLRDKAGPMLDKMAKGFEEDSFNYLLILRLVPLFPFWLVNLAPAFLGVGLRTYVIATAIGIIPGSFVYASVGTGIGSVFDSDETFDPRNIITTEIIVALVGLAVLAAIPVLYKKFARK
ncbi:MAG: TVP38/TMEM64 family protein [Alphaproteobacteria bacterium]